MNSAELPRDSPESVRAIQERSQLGFAAIPGLAKCEQARRLCRYDSNYQNVDG
jgi:hypothetical protein